MDEETRVTRACTMAEVPPMPVNFRSREKPKPTKTMSDDDWATYWRAIDDWEVTRAVEWIREFQQKWSEP